MRNEQIHSKFAVTPPVLSIVTAKSVDQTNEIECHSSSQSVKRKKRWLSRFIYAVIRLAQTPSYEAFEEELGVCKKKQKQKRRAKSESECSLNEWKHQNISEAFRSSASFNYRLSFEKTTRSVTSEWRDWESLLRKTANVNLYQVTKFSLYLSFTVYYNSKDIGRFTPVLSILKIV